MALINKIREKSGWAVGAIALGLLIFMVLGDLLGPNSRLFGQQDNIVGEIAGEEITYEEFETALEGLRNNYAAQNGKQPGENEMAQLQDQAWNQMIFKVAFQKEFERLGLAVTDDELVDMVQGNNIHPAIKQSFTDPKTGQFDRAAITKYLNDLKNAPAEQQAAWASFEQSLGPDRMRIKYDNLIKQSVYVTNQEAKAFNQAQNSQATIKYLYVPYFTLSDSAFQVTDAQLQAYLDKNKDRYKGEATRSIEYVTIPVRPSGTDSASAKEEINSLAKEFAGASNDSLFVKANSDTPFNPAYLTKGELPEQLKDANLTKGAVFGPFVNNGVYNIYKVTDMKDGGAAAVRASHILFKPSAETPEAKAEAKAKAEGVLKQIKGGSDFAEMARKHGSDGTASQGGDLGWFREGNMVAEFDKAVFAAKTAGLLPNLVETQFGYHIVKVTNPKTTQGYQVATITRGISSSDDTREQAYRKADELAGLSTNADEFKESIAKDPTLVKAEAKAIRANDRFVNNLSNARQLVRWAFSKDAEIGDVSDAFEIDNQYVVAVLTGKTEKGTPKVDNLREELTAAVRNEEKAKKIMEKLGNGSGTLEAIAAKYGPEAQIRNAGNVTFAAGSIEGAGAEPVAVGKAFGLKPGKRTAPIQGQTGVLMVELQNITPAPEVADLNSLKTQIRTTRSARLDNAVYEAVKAKANITDSRVKFY